METSKAGLAALGLTALLASAGAGAFIASRAAGPATVTVPPAAANPAPASAVEATEAVVDEPAEAAKPEVPAKAQPAPAPAPSIPPPAQVRAQQTPRRAEGRRPAPAAAPVTAPVRPSAPPPAPRSYEPERASTPPQSAPVIERPVEQAPVAEVQQAPEERRPIEPPAPKFDEVTVPADAVIGLQLESTLSSDTARIEDRVNAKVTRDVRAEGRVAIPAGSRVIGSVSEVDRGGKMRERARLGVRFHTVILADGTELPLQTETVVRLGESPGNASAAKVGGGAIGGAILGAILGGGKGAAIGAGVGAGAGTAAVMAGGRRAAQIQAGSPMTVKILSPVTVTVER